MEELQLNDQINNKTSCQFNNNCFPNPYIRSTRCLQSLQSMEKDKTQDNFHQQYGFNNQSLILEAKVRIQQNYDTLTNYIDNLDEKFQQLNKHQLENLSEKHRYFLRRFKKCLTQHKKYSEIYESIESTVIQNPSVQEQINSIEFIKMVSAQTQEKIAQINSTIAIAESQKLQNQTKIMQLKKQLNSLRSVFFTKKRQQVSYQTQISQRQEALKETELQERMKQIRFQKRQKDTLIKDIFHANLQTTQEKLDSLQRWKKTEEEVCFSSIDSAIEQFKSINDSSKSFIKSLQQTKQNFKNRKLKERRKLNNKIVEETNLQNFRIKSRQQCRFKMTEGDNSFINEIITKKNQVTDFSHDQFMKKSPKQVFDILVENKKLKNLLEIIEEAKSTEIKNEILEKRKINFHRSQVYRSNTPHRIKDDQNGEDMVNTSFMQ